MNARRTTSRAAGFSLIELLVVIAIIAILVALLIPAISTVQNKAKRVRTEALLNAIDGGMQLFRGEQLLGGEYPASRSDNAADTSLIANPRETGNSPTVETKISGAHLLAHAMVGFDLLGTTGYKDLNRNGMWADDTHAGDGGAYELDDTTGEVKQPRYGGYVEDKARERITTLKKLADLGLIVTPATPPAWWTTGDTVELPLFADSWDHPILYYRASRAAQTMLGDADGKPGIFRQTDNAILTGSDDTTYQETGIDYGAGPNTAGRLHRISVAAYPPLKPVFTDGINDVLTNTTYDDSLARFILDKTNSSQNRPVRDDYLLISAGTDSVYGTDDDIVNWTRTE